MMNEKNNDFLKRLVVICVFNNDWKRERKQKQVNVTFSLTNSMQGMGQNFIYLNCMVNCSEDYL